MSRKEWLDRNGQGVPRHLLAKRYSLQFSVSLKEAALVVTKWMTYAGEFK